MDRGGSPGDIVRIPLANGRPAYAQLLHDPYLAVYTAEEVAEIGALDGADVLFVVAVAHWPIKNGRWPIIGTLGSDRAVIAIPEFFVQDVVDPFGCRIIDADGRMRMASLKDCESLEPALIWSPEHIETRIEDVRAGRENRVLKDHALRR